MGFLTRILTWVQNSASKHYFHPFHGFSTLQSFSPCATLVLGQRPVWRSCVTQKACLQEMLHWGEFIHESFPCRPLHKAFCFDCYVYSSQSFYDVGLPLIFTLDVHVFFLPWTIWKYVQISWYFTTECFSVYFLGINYFLCNPLIIFTPKKLVIP